MAVKPKCPECGAATEYGDRFCDECGARLTVPFEASTNPCVCGSSDFDIDGFCIECGTKQRRQPGEVIISSSLAAMTDIGCTHTRNDDAFSVVGHEKGDILVVCDGVSNSQTPDIGAVAAAQIASQKLTEHLENGTCSNEEAVKNAIEEAHNTVCLIPYDKQNDLDPPSATIVLALSKVIDGKNLVTVGWLGDSRVYWLSRAGGSLLTRDHSWRNLMVDSGKMTDDEARRDSRSHAIVKCLGTSDIGQLTPCPEPSVKTYELNHEGWLLVCTDGLWNYAETPSQLIAAANGTLWTSNAIDISRRLIAFAKSKGGHDNITVALVKINQNEP